MIIGCTRVSDFNIVAHHTCHSTVHQDCLSVLFCTSSALFPIRLSKFCSLLLHMYLREQKYMKEQTENKDQMNTKCIGGHSHTFSLDTHNVQGSSKLIPFVLFP